MKVVLVPNHVRDAINEKLDKAFDCIVISDEEREEHYNTLLNYYDKFGVVPDFDIAPDDSPKGARRG